MKNHKEYINGVITMFKLFRRDKITIIELNRYLELINSMIQSKYKYSKDKGIWFRFFNNDTLATTPNDIIRDIINSTENNKSHILECIDISIKNPSEFKIYFS
jgi:hypothetical protein